MTNVSLCYTPPDAPAVLVTTTTSTTTTINPFTAPPWGPSHGGSGSRYPIMSDYDLKSPMRFPDVRFFALKFVFRINVTMSDQERMAQKLRLFAVRKEPRCLGNIISWAGLGDVHPMFVQLGYPGIWAFFIKYRNPDYLPFDAQNYWFSRHMRGKLDPLLGEYVDFQVGSLFYVNIRSLVVISPRIMSFVFVQHLIH